MERYTFLKVSVIVFTMLFILSYCGGTNNRPATLEDIIPISIKSAPSGADVYIRISSDSPEVQNTNRSHIGTTPYRPNRTVAAFSRKIKPHQIVGRRCSDFSN